MTWAYRFFPVDRKAAIRVASRDGRSVQTPKSRYPERIPLMTRPEFGPTLTLVEIATELRAQLVSRPGRESSDVGSVRIVDAMPPGEAQVGHVTMIDQVRHLECLADCPADAVIVPARIDTDARIPPHQLIVDDPHAALTRLITTFRPPLDNSVPMAAIDATATVHPDSQVHPSATIGPHVTIGAGAKIHPNVTVAGGCQIGVDCTLHAGVTLYPYCRLGDRVTVHAGAVIGANGFGYRVVNGQHVPTAQLGFVVIESDVEVGACATIDRGTYGATRIGEGTKIDNQVMIAHNCQIGKHNLLCSQVGIAGSSSTGDYVVLAGQVGLKDHVHLGDRVVVGAQSGVMEDLDGDQVYLGSPATSQRDQMQIMAVQRRLPEMRRELRRLEKFIKDVSVPRVDRRAA